MYKKVLIYIIFIKKTLTVKKSCHLNNNNLLKIDCLEVIYLANNPISIMQSTLVLQLCLTNPK